MPAKAEFQRGLVVGRKSWSADEDSFLAANWGILSPDEVAQRLGRTRASVQNHAVVKGIAKTKPPDWTSDEIQRMQDLWGIKTIPQIAKIMGRSETAIVVKSQRIGLGAYKDYSEYLPARQVSDLLGVDVHAVTDSWIPKHGLKCRFIAPRGCKKFTYIRISHLMDWLQENTDKWDSRRVELFALGAEPEWLKEKRKSDHGKPPRQMPNWTKAEDQRAISLYKTGKYTIDQIAEQIGRTHSAVEHRLMRLDVWGTGEYVGESKQLERRKRRELSERMTLVAQLRDVLLCRRNQLAFDGFWQKDMCMCWDDIKGCTAAEQDCDSCTSFLRIQPQCCARCGGTFFERKNNRFCSGCRQARKRQQQRKWVREQSRRKG